MLGFGFAKTIALHPEKNKFSLSGNSMQVTLYL